MAIWLCAGAEAFQAKEITRAEIQGGPVTEGRQWWVKTRWLEALMVNGKRLNLTYIDI